VKGRRLANPAGAGHRYQRKRKLSRRAGRVSGRGSLREVGGQAFADRSGIRIRRTWGSDRQDIHVGGRISSGWKWMANTWQGKFPVKDAGEDGYAGLARWAKFPANGYDFTICPATFGNGAAIGIGRTITRPWPKLRRRPKSTWARVSIRSAEPNERNAAPWRLVSLPMINYCSRYIVGTRGKGEV